MVLRSVESCNDGELFVSINHCLSILLFWYWLLEMKKMFSQLRHVFAVCTVDVDFSGRNR